MVLTYEINNVYYWIIYTLLMVTENNARHICLILPGVFLHLTPD